MTNLQKVPEGLIDKNRGWNWRNQKFNSQLRVKLHKSETKNQIAIEVLRGLIALNQKFMVN